MVEEAERFFLANVADEEKAYNLLLLASEAVTNGIEHGNKYDETKKVTVTYECDDGRALISVTDEGNGFSPEDVADPLAAEQLYADRGRGLFLMEQIADEVRFEEHGRRVVLIVNLK
jgi:serine/threonine-protein kinase RsbW